MMCQMERRIVAVYVVFLETKIVIKNSKAYCAVLLFLKIRAKRYVKRIYSMK